MLKQEQKNMAYINGFKISVKTSLLFFQKMKKYIFESGIENKGKN